MAQCNTIQYDIQDMDPEELAARKEVKQWRADRQRLERIRKVTDSIV